MIDSKKYYVVRATTPLGLLTLAACGGGGGGGGASGSLGLSASAFSGAVVNSPLTGARVFLDLADAETGEFNGVLDNGELRTISGANGAFQFSAEQMSGLSGETYRIVATADDSVTVTNSEGQVVENISLVASSDSSVVTPLTTLLEAQDIDIEDFKVVMGLDFDPRTFNPYEDVADPNALAAATKAKQVMTVLESVAATAGAAGADQEQAFKSAVEAFVDVIATKAAESGSRTLDLDGTTGSTDLDTLVEDGLAKVKTDQAGSVDTVVLDALEADVKSAVGNVAKEIGAKSSGEGATLQGSLDTFKAVNILKTQLAETTEAVKEEVDAVVGDADAKAAAAASAKIANADKLSLKNEGSVAQEVATANNNQAPQEVYFLATSDTSTTTAENSKTLKIGSLQVLDKNVDGSGDIGHKMSLVQDSETDWEMFSLSGNELSLKAAADFETVVGADGVAELSVKVKVTDSYQQSKVETLTIVVSGVNERPSFEVTSSSLSVSTVSPITTSFVLLVTDPENDKLEFSSGADSADEETGVLTLTGTYGTLTVQSDGSVSYALAEDGSAYINLKAGEQKTEEFTIVAKEANTDPALSTKTPHVVTVTVTGADDAPSVPVVVGKPLDVDENDSVYTLGTFSAEDPDGDAVTLSLVEDGLTSAFISAFTLDTETGEATLNKSWNYEVDGDKIAFSIKAEANGKSTVSDFEIAVNDLNDAPVVVYVIDSILYPGASSGITFSPFYEDATRTTVELDNAITFADEDKDTLEYSIFKKLDDGSLDDAPGWLSINKDTGEVTGSPADGDSGGVFQIIADDGEVESYIDATILVTPVNDKPVFSLTTEQASVNIGAGDAGAIVVSNLSATDEEDAVSDLTYWIKTVDSVGQTTYATSADVYEVINNRVRIKSDAATADREDASETITLVAKDKGGLYSDEVAVTVNFVTASNPEVISFSAESSDGGRVVGTGQITISAVMSKEVYTGGEFEAQLRFGDAGANTVTFTQDSTDKALFTHVMSIDAGTINTDSLVVGEITTSTVVDTSIDALALTPGPISAALGDLNIAIDTVDPVSTVSQTSGSLPVYTIQEGVAKLTLKINDIDDLGYDETDELRNALDFSKLVWNINNDDNNQFRFKTLNQDGTVASHFVKTATVSGDTLSVTLTKLGKEALEGLTGFGGSNDTLDAEAGFLLDKAGNAQTTARSGIEIDMAESVSPKILEISAALDNTNGTASGFAENTEVITFTAKLSEAVKAGTSFDVDVVVGDGVETITFTAGSASATTPGEGDTYVFSIEEKVTLDSTFGDFEARTLEIQDYSVTDAADQYGNLLVDDTAVASIDDLSSATFARDTAAPASSVAVATAPVYTIVAGTGSDPDVGTLTLTINEVDEMGFADGVSGVDALSSFDFTKLTWNVDGVGTNAFRFETEGANAVSYVSSASLSVSGTVGTVEIALSAAGRTALESLSGFGGSNDTLDAAAGFLLDQAGNGNPANLARSGIEIDMAESVSPKILEISAALDNTNGTASGFAENTEVITFTAKLSEAVKAGTSFDVDVVVGDGVETITFTAGSASATTPGEGDTYVFSIEEKVTLDSTFGDFEARTLEIQDYSVTDAADQYGNLLVDDTAVASIDDLSSATFARDTAAPASSVAVATAPVYTIVAGTGSDPDVGTLTLTINEVDEMGFADGVSGVDALSSFDFTKLTWNVDGVGTNAFRFETEGANAVSYVSSASLSVSGTVGTVEIALSAAGRTALESLSGFGGSNDTLDAVAGFLLDQAGNASATERLDVDVDMFDTVAPQITDIKTLNTDNGGQTFGIHTDQNQGNQIQFQVTLDEAVRAGSEITLNVKRGVDDQGGAVSLAGSVVVKADADSTVLTGFYDIQEGDDSSGLEILSYTVGDDSVDLYGNEISGDEAPASVDAITAFDIDATVPAVYLPIWNTVGENDIINIVFSEALSVSNQAVILAEISSDSELGLNGSTASWSANDQGDSIFSVQTTSPLADGTTGPQLLTDLDLQIEDLAGNITLIDEIEFTIIS